MTVGIIPSGFYLQTRCRKQTCSIIDTICSEFPPWLQSTEKSAPFNLDKSWLGFFTRGTAPGIRQGREGCSRRNILGRVTFLRIIVIPACITPVHIHIRVGWWDYFFHTLLYAEILHMLYLKTGMCEINTLIGSPCCLTDLHWRIFDITWLRVWLIYVM